MTNILTQEQLEKLKQKFELNDVVFAALFGSYAKGQATPKSDVDILINYKKEARPTYFDLIDLEEKIQNILKKKVDLVTKPALNKYIKQEVLNTMKIIYQF